MDSTGAYIKRRMALPFNSFTRDGYEFAGWSTTPDGTNGISLHDGQTIYAMTEKTVTLYAQWVEEIKSE